MREVGAGDAVRLDRVRGDGREGFVLAVVVFVLFAVGLAGTAAYQLVRMEADLSSQGWQGEQALAVARAGLDRFVGAHYGVPPDSTDFVIGTGRAVIRTRKVAERDSLTDLYHIQSVGTVADARFPTSPARRVVHQYALLHKDPVGVHAALMTAATSVLVNDGSVVDGNDQASLGACPVGGFHDQVGVISTGSVGGDGSGTVTGAAGSATFADHAALLDSAGVRWDVLQSSSFSIVHDGAPPNWASVAADSFPVVRATENLSASSAWSGRGVLIVPGELSITSPFDWDGVILAGSLGDIDSSQIDIRGLVIGGLDGGQTTVVLRGIDVRYQSCNVVAASRSIAYLEPLTNTFFEGT